MKNTNKRVFLITNIEEYGKFISYCIRNDINVWRIYWDEREKGAQCYCIDYQKNSCTYASREYWEMYGYIVITPVFEIDKYGKYTIKRTEDKK